MLLILLILLSILIIIRVSVEGFENSTPNVKEIKLSQNTIDNYNNFKEFYNKFMQNWEKAIISAIALNTESSITTQPTKPSIDQMNKYIVSLSKELEKPLPNVTVLLPDTIDSIKLSEIIKIIPDNSEMYVNALEWMNRNLEKSQENLNKSISGRPIEQFEDIYRDECKDISKCLDDPDVVAKLTEAQNKKEEDKIHNNEALLSSRVSSFLSNIKLKPLVDNNIKLFKNADDIKNKASSGQLLNDIKLPTEMEQKFTRIINKPLNSKDASILDDSNMMSLVNSLQQINNIF